MKAARLTPKYVRQTAEKTRKKAFRTAIRKASQPLAIHGTRERTPSHGVPNLELYQKENCRFSHAVRSRLSQIGLDYILHNVPDELSLKHEQLAQAGGKDEIPFLMDRKTGVKLYGSTPILSYLEKEYTIPKNTPIGEWIHKVSFQIQSQAEELAWAIRNPVDQAQILAEDLAEGWQSLRNSYQAIRNALRQTTSERTPKRGSTKGESPSS